LQFASAVLSALPILTKTLIKKSTFISQEKLKNDLKKLILDSNFVSLGNVVAYRQFSFFLFFGGGAAEVMTPLTPPWIRVSSLGNGGLMIKSEITAGIFLQSFILVYLHSARKRRERLRQDQRERDA